MLLGCVTLVYLYFKEYLIQALKKDSSIILHNVRAVGSVIQVFIMQLYVWVAFAQNKFQH